MKNDTGDGIVGSQNFRHISASLQFVLENRKQSMLCFDEDCFVFFAIEREQLSGHNNHEHDCGRFIDDSLERDETERGDANRGVSDRHLQHNTTHIAP